MSFDEYDTKAKASSAGPSNPAVRYAVHGNASGLEGDTVTLLLGNTSLQVKDGAFTFPSSLTDGEHWLVTAPETNTHACTVAHGEGVIAGADAMGVAVACVSKDASLSRLEVLNAALSPTFAPLTTSYEVHQRSLGLFFPASARVFANATHPLASVTIAGVALGVDGAEIPLRLGANAVEIDVTAPDERTRARYTVSIALDGRDDPVLAPLESRSLALGADTLALCFGNAYLPGHLWAYERTSAAGSGPATWAAPAVLSSAHAVALDGNTMVVGRADGAHIFNRAASGWSETAFLPGTARTVAIAGDTVALAGGVPGAPDPTQRVSVYFRTGSTWSLQSSFDFASFSPSDPPTALALSGDTLAVGTAYEAWNHLRTPNAVFMYARTGGTWTQTAYIPNLTNTGEGGFGTAVGIWDDWLAVGAPVESKVYFYFRNEGGSPPWVSYNAKTLTNDLGVPSYGGTSIAMSGDILAIGAPSAPDGTLVVGGPNRSSGAVHVFTFSQNDWTQGLYVLAPEPKNEARFGAAVATYGGRLVVAEPGTGRVYGF